MVDVPQTSEQIREPKIRLNISHQELKQLLGVLSESFSLANPPADVRSQRKIDPNFFSNEFAPDKTEFYYVNPFFRDREAAGAAGATNDLHVLFRKDIIHLFEDIYDELIKKGHLGSTDHLGKEEADFLKRLENGLRNNKEFLETDITFFYRVVDQLEKGEEKEEVEPEVERALHPRLLEIKNAEFSPAVSWPYIQKLATDASKARIGVTTIQTTVDNEPFTIEVTELREFLNEWLEKLYSDDFKPTLELKQIVLPANEEFNTYSRFFAYTDREDWNELDVPIVTFILEKLSPVIAEFLKAKDHAAAPAYVSETADSNESENTQITKDLKEKKDEELSEFLKRFEDMGTTYNKEAERLTRILLPQFFAMHGFQGDIDVLESNDQIDFLIVEREFRTELFNIIRSLNAEELGYLQEKGGAFKFRLLVLRKLYGKLGTNPRFIASLNRYKDVFAEKIEKQVRDGEISEAQADKQLRAINRQIELSDESFADQVIRKERTDPTEWAPSLAAKEGKNTVQGFSDLTNLTQADYQAILARLIGGEELGFDMEILLRNLDVIIAERWSPERIRNLSISNAGIVFGLTLPKELTGNTQNYRHFLNVTAEYLYARRQRLANHYEIDAISRENGKFFAVDKDGNVVDRSSATPTGADIDSLKKAQGMASKHKGGGEALIAARASDSNRIKQYKGGNTLAGSIETLHKETQDDRQKEFDEAEKEQEKTFNSMSIADKRAFLMSLGVLDLESEEVNVEDDSILILLNQQYQSAMKRDKGDYARDLNALSLYEDQDDGVVQEESGKPGAAPRTERFGRPTNPHSMMNGSLKVRSKLQGLKKGLANVKKKLQAIDKASEVLEKAIATPIMGPLAQDKATRRVGLAIIGGLFYDFMRMLLEGGWISKGLSFVFGGAGFYIGGTVLGFGAVPGTLLGAYGGMKLGWEIEKGLGWHPDPGSGTTAASRGGLDLNLGGRGGNMLTPTPAAATLVPNSALLPSAATVTPQLVAMCATGAYAGSILMSNMSAFMAGLQPPTLGTIGEDGTESMYVRIVKTSVTGTQFDNSSIPESITYRIIVESRENYRIEITGFEDEFRVTTNDAEREGEAAPPTPSCPNLTFENTPNRVVHANGTLDPGEVADGQLLIGECTVPIGSAYHDTGLFNSFEITFNVTPEGQPPLTGQKAESGELVCFGECPQNQEACWPTNGRLTQGPYGSYSHSVVDAIDIGAPVNTEVYATFQGTAWFFNTYDDNPANQGYVFKRTNGSTSRIYGQHVILVADQGFVLLYGHLNRFESEFELGRPYPVTPGTLLGGVGNTGSRDMPMGMHLHYEYRVSTGRDWHSLAAGGRRLLETVIPEPYSEGLQVSHCYD